MTDKRNTLKAHWPPRKRQTIQVELDAELYRRLYISAFGENSLAEEIRTRLRRDLGIQGSEE